MRTQLLFIVIITTFLLTSCDKLKAVFQKNNNPVDSTAVEIDTNTLSGVETPTIKALNVKISNSPDNPELYYLRSNEYLKMEFTAEAFKDIFILRLF